MKGSDRKTSIILHCTISAIKQKTLTPKTAKKYIYISTNVLESAQITKVPQLPHITCQQDWTKIHIIHRNNIVTTVKDDGQKCKFSGLFFCFVCFFLINCIKFWVWRNVARNMHHWWNIWEVTFLSWDICSEFYQLAKIAS